MTEAEPSHEPKQLASTLSDASTIIGGSVITTGIVATHPLLSVTITLYRPAHNPIAVVVVWVNGSSHRYVYGAVPPTVVAEAVPSQALLHDTLVVPEIETTRSAGSVIVTLSLAEQPNESVTVT